MRLAIYTDYAYHREHDRIFAERAFAVFLAEFAESLDRAVVVGRLDPTPARARYMLPPQIDFVPLAYYESLAAPLPALAAMARSVRRLWTALDDVDAVWLLGPNPLSLPFAALAVARRRRVFLGVRQDFPAYVRRRRPGRRGLQAIALLLEASYRVLALRCPTVVVGPALARRYRHARKRLEITVSLIRDADITAKEEALGRRYEGEMTILSVGRLDSEKNPLMLADVLARLPGNGSRHWRLLVFGEGPLEQELRRRAVELRIAARVALRGYAPFAAMLDEYRRADVLLITSWTEGLPQVLVEALGAGLPVVATDVGGIREAAGEAVTVVPPGDADAAAAAVLRLATQRERREAAVLAGLEYARLHTLERETARLRRFLEGICAN